MRKIFGKILLLICLVAICLSTPTVAQADYFADNTLIYTHYNDKADYYANLAGINQVAVNNKYITYSLNNDIYIINRTTKHTTHILGNLDVVDDIIMTTNYIFVVSDTEIITYDLRTKIQDSIYTDTAKTNKLSGYKGYSISESDDKIVIACISDNSFIAHFYNSNTMIYISSYTNSAINSEISNTESDFRLENITTNNTTAYIINNYTNSKAESLWKVTYSSTNTFTKSLFTKPDIKSLAIYTHSNSDITEDYLLAVDNNNSIYVHRTDFTEYNSEKEYADYIKTKSLADAGFVANDISTAEDICLFNDNVYVSDSGTKCIQEFKFRKTEKASIYGTKVVVASECGEVGRFGKNSNIHYQNGSIIVSDANNRRVQIITDQSITSYDKDTLGEKPDQLENLSHSYLYNDTLYIMSYTKLNRQNIYTYNTNTHDLDLKAHNVEKVLDTTIHNNTIYILSSNGIYIINASTGLISPILNGTFADNSKIAYLSSGHLVVAQDRQLTFYIINSTHATSIQNVSMAYNIADITSIDNTLYILAEDNKIIRYNINDSLELNNESTLSFNETDYSAITIDPNTGILFAFDNITCRIDKIINPTFNFIANSGVYQVNNKNVSVYNRPYFLNGIDSPNVIKTLDVNTRINVFSKTSINYGNIDYYIIDLGNSEYGYINVDDLTYLSEVINYETIHPNASIRAYDDTEYVNIYEYPSLDSEILATAPVGTRIYIENYDASDEFSYVRYYDKDQQLVEGYIYNNLVDADAMSHTQMVALILIACSIVLLIAILITVKVIRHRRNKNMRTTE